jgi:hypothetical protein
MLCNCKKILHNGIARANIIRHTQLRLLEHLDEIGSKLARFHLGGWNGHPKRRKLMTRYDSRTRDIHKWLSASDPSMNYNAAKEKRQQNTGRWLLNSTEYKEWKTKPDSKLWLKGKPGYGKTVLSSTTIEDLLSVYQDIPQVAILFFYFRYDVRTTQGGDDQYNQMLRSLLVQLSHQCQTLPDKLDELYEKHLNGGRQPSNSDIAITITDLLSGFGHVFLVLDGLDECDEIRSILKFLKQLAEKPISGLHLLATSRNYDIIEESLESFDQIRLEEEVVVEDIALFVDEELAGSDFEGFPKILS